ncbi:MAG: hypothetical protein HY735_24930 [Verrucomicrobia bacterium]|nr:hypothetical protein [Verrucomicrobiota bacterium]
MPTYARFAPVTFLMPANVLGPEHDALAGLVERILSAKRLPVPARQTGTDPLADTSALEREIDQRVYRLYALTPDEIQLVEEAR